MFIVIVLAVIMLVSAIIMFPRENFDFVCVCCIIAMIVSLFFIFNVVSYQVEIDTERENQQINLINTKINSLELISSEKVLAKVMQNEKSTVYDRNGTAHVTLNSRVVFNEISKSYNTEEAYSYIDKNYVGEDGLTVYLNTYKYNNQEYKFILFNQVLTNEDKNYILSKINL